MHIKIFFSEILIACSLLCRGTSYIIKRITIRVRLHFNIFLKTLCDSHRSEFRNSIMVETYDVINNGKIQQKNNGLISFIFIINYNCHTYFQTWPGSHYTFSINTICHKIFEEQFKHPPYLRNRLC